MVRVPPVNSSDKIMAGTVAILPVRPAFRREFLDFERGIRMGGLEPNERITQIVKAHLVARHGQPFIIDKWGRGRFWRWICWLPRAGRDSKPRSSAYNFSCAKFFLSLFPGEGELAAGLQIERAALRRGRGRADEVYLEDDWDWHRLVAGLRKGTALEAELARLVGREGFTATAGPFSDMTTFRGRRWGGVAAIRRACTRIPATEWGGFQLYYPMCEKDVREMSGEEIVAAILAVFDEVAPAMNLIMQEPHLRGISSASGIGSKCSRKPP
jgi:hypothetical protein